MYSFLNSNIHNIYYLLDSQALSQLLELDILSSGRH